MSKSPQSIPARHPVSVIPIKFGIRKLKPVLISVTPLALALLLPGCGAKFTSQRYHPLTDGYAYRGATYKLPKSIVKYEVNLAVYKVTEGGKSSHFAWIDPDGTAEKPSIRLSSTAVGDDRRTYVIDTGNLSAFMVHTKGTGFSLGKDGMLTAANGEFDDKTTEVIESVVASGLKVAKLAASGGFSGLSTNQSKERNMEKLGVVPVVGEVQYGDVAGENRGGRSLYRIPVDVVAKQAELMFGVTGLTIPRLNLVFDAPYGESKSIPARGNLKLRGASDSAKQDGIWVQQAANVGVAVTINNYAVLKDRLIIADAGPTTLLPIRSKFASDRNTVLAFHTDTGGLQSHSLTATSQGEKISKSAGTIIDNAATELPLIKAEKEKRISAIESLSSEIAVKDRLQDEKNGDLKALTAQGKNLSAEQAALSVKEVPEAETENLAAEKAAKDSEVLALQKKIAATKIEISDLDVAIESLKQKRDRQ